MFLKCISEKIFKKVGEVKRKRYCMIKMLPFFYKNQAQPVETHQKLHFFNHINNILRLIISRIGEN